MRAYDHESPAVDCCIIFANLPPLGLIIVTDKQSLHISCRWVFYIFDQDWSKSWIDPNRKWLIYKVLWNSIQSRGLNNIFSLRNSLKKRAVGADLQQPPKFKFKIKNLSCRRSFSIRNSLRNDRLEWNLQQPPFFEFEIQKSRAPLFRQILFLT